MPTSQFEARLAAMPPNFGGRLQAIIQFVRDNADDLIDSLGGNAAVVTYVHGLYDKYVVPLDLPGVPSLAEPIVDRAVKSILSALIFAVDDE